MTVTPELADQTGRRAIIGPPEYTLQGLGCPAEPNAPAEQLPNV